MTDDRTSTLNLPKPHASNTLSEDVERLRTALDGIDTAIAAREVASQKGQPNGYAGLDSSGKVPAAQLPSFVDDVVEVANLAALPGTGETGKIYVTIDTGKTYRWGGSAYVEISPSPGSTDSVPEGATNKYFTDARARSAQQPATASALGVIKVGSGLSVGLDGTLSIVGGGGGEGLPAFNELVLVPTSNGQTTFTPDGGYSVGEIELYLNGVLLYGNGDDYTASNGTTIVLAAGVSTSDSLLLRRWTTTDNLPFSALTDKPTSLAGYGITDAVPIAGNVTLTGHISVPSGASGTQVPRAQDIPSLVRAMLLGTVAQSGGTPTGAVFEYGANANGFYVRFANGLQICWLDVALGITSNVMGSLFSTATVSGNWPANFSTTPKVVASAKQSANALVWCTNVLASTTGFAMLQGVSVINSATANADLVAVGRWF